MPAPFRRTLEDLRTQARRLLQNSGKVTNLSEGGTAKSLLDITTLQISELYNALDFLAAMSRHTTASGVFLDMIGQSRGVTRTGALAGVVVREDQAIKFYSNDGAAPLKGLLPSGKVASGTLITSSDSKVTYQVTEDVFPDDVQTELFVPAASQSTGAGQNVGKGVLSTHNLGVGDVSVTNVESIASAQDTESDANYRFRISRSLSQAAGATEDAVRLAAFSVPGVAEVFLRPFADGVGTFEVLAVPVGNRFPPDTLRAIEALVKRAAAYGTRVKVRAPTELPAQMTIQLDFDKAATSTDRSNVREQVRQAVLRYLAEIPVGGALVLNELTQRVMDVSSQIFDMRILLFRFRSQNHVLRNVQADPDEIFAPDPASQNPIKVV